MEPYMGMIFLFGGNFAIKGFALCNGQIVAIQQNTALFSLLGTIYGGNGVQTFALPNLQGRTPIHWGQSNTGSTYVIGQQAGTENVTILTNNMPMHTHTADISKLTTNTAASTAAGTSPTPGPTMLPALLPSIGSGPAKAPINGYAPQATGPNTNFYPSPAAGSITIGTTGGSQPMNIQNPYLAVTYLIAMQGIFPSRN